MQAILAAMSRGDLDAFIDAMAEDVRWVWMGSCAWSRTFEGKDAVVHGLLAAAKGTLADGGTTIAHAFIAVPVRRWQAGRTP